MEADNLDICTIKICDGEYMSISRLLLELLSLSANCYSAFSLKIEGLRMNQWIAQTISLINFTYFKARLFKKQKKNKKNEKFTLWRAMLH